jgi:hypothetical protein
MPTAAEYQEAGRKTKAFKLAQILRQNRISSKTAALLSPDDWSGVAQFAGQKPPSEVTVRYTVERLAEFERADAEVFA